MMKNSLISACLGLLAVTLCGCFKTDNAPPTPTLANAGSVTISEIDAAAGLTYDNNRLEALKAIASRPTLSPVAQVHLAQRIFTAFPFENSKISLLEILIKNPAFCNPAKQAILTNLDNFTFENNKTALLAMLNRRGDLKD